MILTFDTSNGTVVALIKNELVLEGVKGSGVSRKYRGKHRKRIKADRVKLVGFFNLNKL